nr:acyl-CoA carboxylase epsilon subunit [Kineosphaera limosa]
MFRVERGDPSPEEVAALSVVVAALAWGGEPEPEPAAKRRGWGSRWQVLRPRMMRGHGWGGR